MDRTEQIVFETLELEFRLTQLLKKREQLYLKGGNDEKLNDKITFALNYFSKPHTV